MQTVQEKQENTQHKQIENTKIRQSAEEAGADSTGDGGA